MRFSKLKLNGFKSFVDPTDLTIADGLTGVVGPNGCGKSNLLEALRWVMGETRPKAMRGGGMEDVIFAGASSRPARNFAEVSLTIDNQDRLAPAAFNDQDQLEIIRRITRDVGSAFKANGKDTRARDVQMLFADASTGAHSPSLVRQGQIAELINAKPKARRRILEEAAGISGLYQRRHEAELKLKNTEQNLLRVDDVIEQLATQLSQLGRQAKQAMRYRSIGENLRMAEGTLLYRRWLEADQTCVAAQAALTTRSAQAAKAEALARLAGEKRGEAENALPPLREEEAIAVAVLQRLFAQRETLSEQEAQARQTIETLNNRIGQLAQDIDREGGLSRDAGETIERLEWEARELNKARDGQDDRLQEAEETAEAATEVLKEREDNLAQVTEDVARLAARHQSARRLVEDCQRALTRAADEGASARDAAEAAREALESAQDRLEQAGEAEQLARDAVEAAEEELMASEETRAGCETQEADARKARGEAEGELGALQAEVTALAKLVERDTVEGGQILDDLQVQSGFEKALGAAVADDLRAPLAQADGPSGWLDLPQYDNALALPEGVTPLAAYVRAPAALARRLSQIGVVDADTAQALQVDLLPGQRLVTVTGDLWRWDGFRAWAEDAPSAAALRLEQMNRLARLKQDADDCATRTETVRQTHEQQLRQLETAKQAEQAARQARRTADQRVAEAARALSRAEADRNVAQGKVETLGVAVARHESDAAEAQSRLTEAQAGQSHLGDLDAARATVEDIKHTVEAARITMLTHRSTHDELRRQGAARLRRAQEVTKELSGWKHRQETAAKRVSELITRRETAEDELEVAMALPAEIAETREELAETITGAELRKSSATEAVVAAEAVLRDAVQAERDAERLASDAREERARTEALAESAKETLNAAAARILEEQQVSPEVLLEQLDIAVDDMESAEVLEEQVAVLKRQRDNLGAVNLRAEEDAREVQEEHDQLVSEKSDLEEAIKTLRGGIAGLNKEGRERLLTAFEQVNSSFSMLFQHLFGGGEAKLMMVESDDPLDAGLEIMCQPPGKKLSTLSLLSGGEQTLTALALIFAVFLSNPAPICVLDEVDAPLDDANVTRFCDLLDEMTRQTDTRFLIITHHAVTMSRMDRLFGVTMQEKGVSQLVSVDLKKAETMVA
ncbi:chromosome segregation SMC family protein [Epibacterium ulvae]|uniref:chromosome segregation SMC family protein n=1 Tax=Epibacterium ulvae TaxID=1156985 RepID=UPI00248FEFD5|nr:AAA family ATPase [Epibacterium ulvae]